MKTFLFLLIVFVSEAVFAQSSSRFAITRDVIAGGGATTNASARFQLSGTVGQPLAAVPASSRFSIQGGFWIRPSPVMFAPAKVGTNFVVSIQSELGKTYTLQYSDSPSSQNWQNLPSITGTGAVITVTNSASGIARRFYRLVEQ